MEMTMLFAFGFILGMLLMGCLVGVHLLLQMFKSIEKCLKEPDDQI